MSLGKICLAFAALIFLLLCFKIVESTDKIDIVMGAFALLAIGILLEGVVIKIPTTIVQKE